MYEYTKTVVISYIIINLAVSVILARQCRWRSIETVIIWCASIRS